MGAPSLQLSAFFACRAQGIGYGLSLGGFFWYNYIKMQKPAPSAAGATPPARRSDYSAVAAKEPDARKGEA